MLKSSIFKLSVIAVIFALVIPYDSSYSEELETIQIEIKYTNGDRIDTYQVKYVVYQDNEKTPIIEKNIISNPDSITLPQNHNYKIEVYVNGMYSEVGYVELKDKPEKLDINIPLPGGIKFNVFFEDGETPIENAVVIIKSHEGEEQRVGDTNNQGETMRYWLQSTSLQNNYYVAEVYYDDILLTSFSNIKIHQGISQDQKISAPIPAVVEELITFRLYDTESQKIIKQDGEFSIVLVDNNGVHYKESTINNKGEIYFSNVPSGVYSVLVAQDGLNDNQWENPKITLTGSQNNFDLFQLNEKKIISQPFNPVISLPISEPIIYESVTKQYELSCNCVSFRFDDVQDYWLNNIQIELINIFSENKLPLTIGVIIDSFGDDSKLVEVVKNEITTNTLEIANHGLDSTSFTIFDEQKQNEMLNEANNKIYEKLGVSPSTFIPPENKFNDDTKKILEENGFTHLSASMFSDAPPFPLQNESLYRFPEITTSGEFIPSQNRFLGISSDRTFSEILDGIDKYGFAVVTLHPQEFSIFMGNEYKNELNLDQIQELKNLLDRIKSDNIEVVHIGQIDQKISKIIISESKKIDSNQKLIPSWIKNNAGWWRDGHIDDNSFIRGIQFLINEGIMQIPATTMGSSGSEIPNWIKNNAGWWAESRISDDDFIYGVNYLVTHGIIVIDL